MINTVIRRDALYQGGTCIQLKDVVIKILCLSLQDRPIHEVNQTLTNYSKECLTSLSILKYKCISQQLAQ